MSDRRKILDLFEEQDAFWKQRAAEGIERYRKGNGKLTVVDENGIPVPNLKIKITQKSHEFRFGANVFMLDELETPEKNDAYKKYFSDVFNMATLPFYWDSLEPEKGKPRYAKDSPKVYRRPSPDSCIEFCEKYGIEPREHALAYDNFFPKWLYDASVEEVKCELERRYAEISRRYADKIPTIEVTNEMEWEKGKTKFYDEPDFVEWCFKLAEKYFPNNQLVINEHTSLCWADKCRATDKYYSYIEANMLKGARIDAIGMQYHLFNKSEIEYEKTRFTLNPKNIYKHMDLYSNLGNPLQITEVTIPAYSWEKEDEEIQAEIIEKLYSIWFSHPNVEQIVYWNLVDGYAHFWDPDPEKIKASQGDMSLGENYYYGGLLRFDLSPKPAYLKIKELIQEKWHTETELVTDTNGSVTFRGFYGTYDIEIEGKEEVTTFNLSTKSENEKNITL
ncbi:MAG: endo-1,4-beta-xylanase [Clostridia bacterium]|nr:endo-1,4-beta-xylanase [Clostridia bacterium]